MFFPSENPVIEAAGSGDLRCGYLSSQTTRTSKPGRTVTTEMPKEKAMKNWMGLWSTGVLAVTLCGIASAQSPSEIWTGEATVHGQAVPVTLRLHLDGKGSANGSFLNDQETANST